jgi:hypothetical protein
MPTRQVESTHEAEPNHPIQDPSKPGVESPSGDRMQGANGSAPRGDESTADAGEMHAAPDPSAAGPRESVPADKAVPTTNEDDATSGDQDIDTAGTAHDDLSPTKSM